MIDLIKHLSVDLNLSLIVFLTVTFIVSGIIKGFLGLGLPSTAMGLLTLVIEPIHAISVLWWHQFYLVIYFNMQEVLTHIKHI